MYLRNPKLAADFLSFFLSFFSSDNDAAYRDCDTCLVPPCTVTPMLRGVKVKIVKIHCRILLVLSYRTRQHSIFVFTIAHRVLCYLCSS